MGISRISFKYDNLQGTIATVHSGKNLEKQSNFCESANCPFFVRLFVYSGEWALWLSWYCLIRFHHFTPFGSKYIITIKFQQ